ncbi:uncharacterized protein N7500_001317 [Penicillium coprophilum]|uniref:uncharacterized protein n=1 Tax=Penicillium coprophilum TaxID=36646 RepID=UPI0023A59D33|nr:uncharacterized protein N7500_001317 [Penicillium coprophilum]KAJ5178618.1 hypothetical protein N7500_001317 [Penicillium coprophilum]
MVLAIKCTHHPDAGTVVVHLKMSWRGFWVEAIRANLMPRDRVIHDATLGSTSPSLEVEME